MGCGDSLLKSQEVQVDEVEELLFKLNSLVAVCGVNKRYPADYEDSVRKILKQAITVTKSKTIVDSKLIVIIWRLSQQIRDDTPQVSKSLHSLMESLLDVVRRRTPGYTPKAAASSLIPVTFYSQERQYTDLLSHSKYSNHSQRSAKLRPLDGISERNLSEHESSIDGYGFYDSCFFDNRNVVNSKSLNTPSNTESINQYSSSLSSIGCKLHMSSANTTTTSDNMYDSNTTAATIAYDDTQHKEMSYVMRFQNRLDIRDYSAIDLSLNVENDEKGNLNKVEYPRNKKTLFAQQHSLDTDTSLQSSEEDLTFTSILQWYLSQLPFQAADVWVPVLQSFISIPSNQTTNTEEVQPTVGQTFAHSCISKPAVNLTAAQPITSTDSNILKRDVRPVLKMAAAVTTDPNLIQWGEYSKKFTFNLSEGLPGRLLSTREKSEGISRISDVSDSAFVRKTGALLSGIQTCIGFAINCGNISHSYRKDSSTIRTTSTCDSTRLPATTLGTTSAHVAVIESVSGIPIADHSPCQPLTLTASDHYLDTSKLGLVVIFYSTEKVDISEELMAHIESLMSKWTVDINIKQQNVSY